MALWKEAFCGVDLFLLHATPSYYGLGIPRGNGSAVVLIPGFLTHDVFLEHLYSWLERIGYRPYRSGIGLNAECPNLLIKRCLTTTIDKAVRETRRRVHLIGHSLGGVIAHAIAVQRPDDIASVISLGSPLRGTVVHPSVWQAAERVRRQILEHHGSSVFSECYTPRCNCDFSRSLRRTMSRSVAATAIYTRNDGVVDWRYCRTGDPNIDFEVHGTHLGLPFNASVYTIIAARLAEVKCPQSPRRLIVARRGKRPSRAPGVGAGKRATQNVRFTPSPPIPVFDSQASDSPKEILPICTTSSAGMASDGTPGLLPGGKNSGIVTLPSGTWSKFRRTLIMLKQKARRAISAARQKVKQRTHAARLRLSSLVRRIRGVC